MYTDKILGCFGGMIMGEGLGEKPVDDTINCLINIAVSESLSEISMNKMELDNEDRDEEIDRFMSILSRKIKDINELNNKTLDISTMSSLYSFCNGTSWTQSGIPSNFGPDSLPRVIPVGLFLKDNLSIQRVALPLSTMTHTEEDVSCSAVITAILCRMAIEDVPVGTWAYESKKIIKGINTELSNTLSKISLFASNSEKDIGFPTLATEVISFAIYHCMTNPNDIVEAIKSASCSGGEFNTVSLLTGSLMGGKIGLKSFPDNWKKELNNNKFMKLVENLKFN